MQASAGQGLTDFKKLLKRVSSLYSVIYCTLKTFKRIFEIVVDFRARICYYIFKGTDNVPDTSRGHAQVVEYRAVGW